MPVYLSIDIGTSAAKLSLFDEQGALAAAQAVSYPVDYPPAEWAEQDPALWWQAVLRAAPEMVHAAGGRRIAGIAVSGQTPLCAPVDERGQALRPAILWLDRRAAPQAGWLREQVGEARCVSVSRNRLDGYFGGLKWLWFRQNEPDLFARTRWIMQASTFVIYHLTGQVVVDPAQAGLCSPCFDFAAQDWDEDICAAMGLPVERLPRVRPAAQVVGAVSAAAARASGLPEGTPVVCGGADFACAGLGAGLSEAGQAAMMMGTAGNLLFPGASSADPRLLHTIHLTGQPLPFGGVLAGGNLGWFAQLLGDDDPGLFARLDGEAARVPPGSEGLVFLPYLMGERTPIWDPGARGAFVGLSSRHTRAHLYRAILEGVAFAFRQIAEIAAAGSGLRSIVAIDGGARSPLWRQILADALQLPIHAGSQRGGTALGGAFLAALGTGGAASYAEITAWTGPLAPAEQPQPAAARRYDEVYPVYAGLYAKLKPDFEALGKI